MLRIDGSGSVTEDEFRYGLMKIGVAGVTSQDVGLLFHAIDKDKGGTVSYQELRDGLREKLNPTGLRYEGFEYACEMLGKYTNHKSEGAAREWSTFTPSNLFHCHSREWV